MPGLTRYFRGKPNARGVRAGLLTGLLVLSACAAPRSGETEIVFYPALPQQPRVQYLTTINSEEDVGGGSGAFRDFLLGPTDDARSLIRPFDVAHRKDRLYVVDKKLNAVVAIDLKEGTFELVKDKKSGPLKQPTSVFVDENGYVYVSDKQRGQVLVFDEKNEYRMAYGVKGQFEPLDVVVRGNRVYVCDLKDSEVEVLDRDTGQVIQKIGGKGKEEGFFHWPTHLALDAAGNLYVTDFLNFRVQKFDPEGTFVSSVGELGTWPGAMPRPKGIAVDDEGYLYAVDSAFELVQIFDSGTGKALLAFGKYASGPGGSWLPAGIDIDYENVDFFARYLHKDFRAKYVIYVVNQAGNNKLNVYAFGDWLGIVPGLPETPEGEETNLPEGEEPEIPEGAESVPLDQS